MGSDTDYDDMLDDLDMDLDDPVPEELLSSTRSGRGTRDYRRAIENLREEKRLRQLLSDYDLEDDS